MSKLFISSIQIRFELRLIISFSAFILSITSLNGQNCFNSDFETGDADGYRTFVGFIGRDTEISITDELYDPDRHKVGFILDGYDEIAFENCDENKFLPVVPPGGGAFALRLGNSLSLIHI